MPDLFDDSNEYTLTTSGYEYLQLVIVFIVVYAVEYLALYMLEKSCHSIVNKALIKVKDSFNKSFILNFILLRQIRITITANLPFLAQIPKD